MGVFSNERLVTSYWLNSNSSACCWSIPLCLGEPHTQSIKNERTTKEQLNNALYLGVICQGNCKVRASISTACQAN